ncbi:MAG: hypothetical protein EP305_03820 [Bacteroidetes bacterium]|nr:MAG: hypothetical protein EP305_03820 [Bacteroidota bacterium]
MKVLHINWIMLIGIALITILSSCHTIKYENLELTRLNARHHFKRKLNNNRADFNLILHNSDHLTRQAIRYESQNAKVIGDSIIGTVSVAEESDLQFEYYETLSNMERDGESKMKVSIKDREKRLDQLHIWVPSEVFEQNQNQIKLNVKQIKKIEKVETFKKLKLWILIGIPVTFVSLLITWFAIGIAFIGAGIGGF